MRTRILVAAFAACLFAVPSLAAPVESTSDVQRFGASVTVKKPVAIAKLSRKPQGFTGKTIRIEGLVKNVCQGAGCWVEVEDAKGASFIARSLDESVLLPKDCKGQRVVVQGLITALPAKDHDHAQHQGEAAHECPAPRYVLSTQGVELMAKK